MVKNNTQKYNIVDHLDGIWFTILNAHCQATMKAYVLHENTKLRPMSERLYLVEEDFRRPITIV